MATNAGGISIGDAVLSFLADTTQLDAAISRINSETAAKLQSSGAAVATVSKAFDQVGTAAATAAPAIKQAGVAAGEAASNIQQNAKALLAAGLSAQEATNNLVIWGYSQKEAAAATGLTTAAVVEESAALKSVGESAAIAGTEIEAAAVKGGASMIGLQIKTQAVDEAIGVRLPRGVTRFLSSLPGVAGALDAAFSASVVYFLIEALVTASTKLADFISNTYIFTESMKQADEIVKKNDADLAKYGDETKKLADAYALLGTQGVAKTSAEMRLLTRDIDANNKALETAKTRFAELNASLQPSTDNIFLHNEADRQKALDQAQKDHAAEIEQARSEVNTNEAIQKENAQKLLNLKKQFSEEALAAARKAALDEIEIEKERANSSVHLKQEENRQIAIEELLRTGRANEINTRLGEIDATYQLDIYNNEVTAIQRRIALDRTDPSKDPNQLKKDLAKLEEVQRDHASALIKIYVDTIQGINNLSLRESGGGIVDHLLGTDFQDKFAQFEADTQALGLVTSSDLTTSVQNAAAAYTRLKASGLATYDELLHALLKVQQAQLAFDRDLGNTVAAKQDQQAIDNLNRSINTLEGTEAKFTDGIRRQSPVLTAFQTELKNTGSVAMAMGAALGTGISVAMQAYAQGAITIQQALRTMVQAEIQAVASIAEVRGTADLAKAFGDLGDFDYTAAAQHFAAATLWFSLAGAASLGSAELSPKNNSASSASLATGAKSTATASPAQTPTQQPVSVVNAPRLSGGGLFTQRTMAMIGDSPTGGNQREAVLPLGDDSSALDEIAGRIHERMGGGSGGDIHNYNFKGSLISHKDLMKELSKEAKKGGGRLTVNNSFRVTRRG